MAEKWREQVTATATVPVGLASGHVGGRSKTQKKIEEG